MNLFEALHNFATHLLNRSPQDQISSAIEALHDAMVATGHSTAASKLGDAVNGVILADSVVQATKEAAQNPEAPVPVAQPVSGQ